MKKKRVVFGRSRPWNPGGLCINKFYQVGETKRFEFYVMKLFQSERNLQTIGPWQASYPSCKNKHFSCAHTPDGAGISSLPAMDLLYRYGEVQASLGPFSFSLEVHGSS